MRHGAVGGLCFVLNLLLMWSLVSVAGLDVLVATAICFFVTNAVGHHLSRTLVFRHGKYPYETSLMRFTATMAISLALNLSAMAAATRWLGIHYLAASALIAALFFIGNYVAHREWTFR